MNVKGYEIAPKAYLRGADLRGADLRGADLSGADLRGADLIGADLGGVEHIIDLGQRSDGYRHVAFKSDAIYILAGCRYLAISAARYHWQNHVRGGKCPLCQESLALIDHAERLAEIRGWIDG